MSLDVYLYDFTVLECECGRKHEIPTYRVYDANITHNLGGMAQAAGIYFALWHPEDINAKKAKDIINLLQTGLADMKKRPKYYKQFDSPNGWGIYDDFIPFIEEYLKACEANPEAIIKVSR